MRSSARLQEDLVMQSFLRFLLKAFFRVTVTGASSVRRHEPRLFLSNHRSPLDVLLVGMLLPGHPIVIVPPEDAQTRLVRWLLRFVPHAVLDIATASALKPRDPPRRHGAADN